MEVGIENFYLLFYKFEDYKLLFNCTCVYIVGTDSGKGKNTIYGEGKNKILGLRCVITALKA